MVSKNELKFIKSLKVKKYRAREKRFIVEGAKNVLELLKSDYEVDQILCSKYFFEDNTSVLADWKTSIVSDRILADAGSFQTNNSSLAVVRCKEISIDDIDFGKQIFMLDGVSDPGNMGTIIRTLDWFGFDQLVCSPDSAERYNPKVINSTMGSFVRVKSYYTDLDSFLGTYKLPVYGAEMQGKSLFDTKLENPSIVVMGSESHGLSKRVKKRLSSSITIPKFGLAESLNVSIATGIIANHLRIS